MAIVILVVLTAMILRAILRPLLVSSGGDANAPVDQNQIPLTQGDRKDGIQSLCKVFEIYGLPRTDQDAADAAHNAGELFKLAGNQSPGRSAYILSTLAQQFRGGQLKPHDCADAGVPLTSSDAAEPAPPPTQAPAAGP